MRGGERKTVQIQFSAYRHTGSNNSLYTVTTVSGGNGERRGFELGG